MRLTLLTLSLLFGTLPALAADCSPRLSALWRNPHEIQITWLYDAKDCPADHFIVSVESFQIGDDGKLMWHQKPHKVATITTDARVPSLSYTLSKAEPQANHYVRIQAIAADGKAYPPSEWQAVPPYQAVRPLNHAIENATMTITREAPPDAPAVRKPQNTAPTVRNPQPAEPAVVTRPAPAASAQDTPDTAPAPVVAQRNTLPANQPRALPSPCGPDAEDGIEGRVYASNGKPLANAKVQLDYKYRGQPPLTEYTTTNAEGRYCFPGLKRYVRYSVSLADKTLQTERKPKKHTFKDRHIRDIDLRIK